MGNNLQSLYCYICIYISLFPLSLSPSDPRPTRGTGPAPVKASTEWHLGIPEVKSPRDKFRLRTHEVDSNLRRGEHQRALPQMRMSGLLLGY